MTTDDLDYMHARYYNPWLTRFLSVDPAGGKPEVPQSWNGYSYAMNSPVARVDRDGRATDWALGVNVFTDPNLTNIPWQSAATPEGRAIENAIMIPFTAMFAAPLVLPFIPEAAAGDVLIGGAIGLTTSAGNAARSDAPIDTKVNSALVGFGTGLFTGGVFRSGEGGMQAISALVSSNFSNRVINGSWTTGAQNSKEAGKGFIAGDLAGALPGGPVAKALLAGGSKYLLDLLDDWLSGPQDKLADAPVDGPHQH